MSENDLRSQIVTSKLAILDDRIERRILVIRGQKVMLDSDLAELYGVQTFRLNEQVKRNRIRFPHDFMFQLTREEAKSLTSQFARSKRGKGGRRTPPYAFTEQGVAKVERALRIENLYAPENTQLVNHLIQALKAESLYNRDVDYVIQDNEVKIVDEFTGRIMEGRRWSEGLHQAVEAKEGVRIQEEHTTLATITLQNYFRLYEKLGGMTGTAKTEEKEFVEIYNLNVVEIPTNVPVARDDQQDLVFKTKEGKFAAVARDIEEHSKTGQPVLVGTIAVETSEYLSQLLTRRGVKHNVLNAKEHAREATTPDRPESAGSRTMEP